MADVLEAQPVPAIRRHGADGCPYDPGEPPSPDREQPSTPISAQSFMRCSAPQSR
jgi:hypothetical protein